MLIDNARSLAPLPPGMTLSKSGLDFTLTENDRIILVVQGDDGLWRMSEQPLLSLSAPGETPAEGEKLELLGSRKVGQIEVLENNSIRLRLASTWFFPTRCGEWVGEAVRQVRWEFTWYADGREITSVEAQQRRRAGTWHGQAVSLRTGGLVRRNYRRENAVRMAGTIARWNCLRCLRDQDSQRLMNDYLRPARLRPAIAEAGEFAPGDIDKDGFDQSQGCYFLRAKGGNCRFTVLPPTQAVLQPVFPG